MEPSCSSSSALPSIKGSATSSSTAAMTASAIASAHLSSAVLCSVSSFAICSGLLLRPLLIATHTPLKYFGDDRHTFLLARKVVPVPPWCEALPSSLALAAAVHNIDGH